MESRWIRGGIEVNRGCHRQYLVPGHYEGPVVRPRFYRAESGETTEGREQCRLLPNDETGQCLPLKTPADQGEPRMHVAGEAISVCAS